MPIDPDYLAKFRHDLLNLPAEEMFQRYILADACVGLADVDERNLRERIATKFGIDLTNVVIVGSAKLGFTLRQKLTNYGSDTRPAFSPFSENSDVDIAIISDSLFDNIWKRCFDFWHSSGYANARGYWPKGKHFRDYIFRGWMRPDHLPSEGGFTYKNEWFDFFRQLTSDRAAGDYKITAALYRETHFFKIYQQIAITECRVGVNTQP